jgi:hypothetical protein
MIGSAIRLTRVPPARSGRTSAMHSNGRSLSTIVASGLTRTFMPSIVTHLRLDDLMTALAWHLSRRDRIASDPDRFSRGMWSYRIRRSRIARTIVFVMDITRHLQTDQQFDIARETADRRVDNAGPFVGNGKLRPRLLKLSKGSTLVVRAAVVVGFQHTLETALSRDVEIRYCVRGGDGRKRSHD